MVNTPQKTFALPAAAKLALDFAPLAIFFVAFRATGDVRSATVVLVIGTALSILTIYLFERKIALAPLISGVLVTVLGGLSVYLNNDHFIKIKPTLVNLLFSAILFGGILFWKRGLLKYVLDIAFQLTDRGWLILSRRWGVFFLFLAGLNEVIWRNFSTDFWVNFKVFGMLTLTMVFAASQIRLIEKHKAPEEPTNNA